MRLPVIENIVKNILLLILLSFGYFEIQSTFNFAEISYTGNLLAAVGILSVIACFGNFAFTYERVDHTKFLNRLVAHTTTGVLMLIIGLSLIMTSFLIRNMIGSLPIFNACLLLLYIASVLYDFWDLQRATLK